MQNVEQAVQFTKEAVQEKIGRILADMTADWDIEFNAEISLDTRLIADLEFESIDVVQLVVAIEEEFESRAIPFNELIMSEGRYVDDLSVRQIVEFLVSHFGRS